MSKLTWDKVGERNFETGVEQGVLYLQEKITAENTKEYPKGAAWNGFTAFTESPSGAEATPVYADNQQYLNLRSAEIFGGTLEAYTYPDEFAECDGSAQVAEGVYIGQQKRRTFGLCYKTLIGNDTDGIDLGYKLHLVYGCSAAPSEKAFATVNDTPEAITLSWELSTTPVKVPGFKPSATLVINSTTCDPAKLAQLEAILYGTDASTDPVVAAKDAYLPLPSEVIALVGAIVG